MTLHTYTHDDSIRHLRGHGAHDAMHLLALNNPENNHLKFSKDGEGRHLHRHQFKSNKQSRVPCVLLVPLRPAGVRIDIDRHLISPVAAVILHGTDTSLSGDGNSGAFDAARLYSRLSQHSDRQVSNTAPSHLKRLSCASVKRPQRTTMEGRKIGTVAQRTHHV